MIPAGTTIMKMPMRVMVRIPPSRRGGSVRLPEEEPPPLAATKDELE